MQLYLIRHAESENNARPRHARVEDPSITPVGRLQTDALARWLAMMPTDVMLTSPFRRTLQTCRQLLQSASPRAVQVWHDVFESGGCYSGYDDIGCQGRPGLARAAIIDELPGALVDKSIGDDGWWGGRDKETDEQTRQRAVDVLNRLQDTFGIGQPRVVAVLHADFIRELLRQMLQPVADPTRFGTLRNTGITKLDFDGTRWQLDWLNSVSHLPPRLITGVQW